MSSVARHVQGCRGKRCGAVAQACRTYIKSESTPAGGAFPLVVIFTSNVDDGGPQQDSEPRFTVHGDMTGLEYTAWHNASDTPTDNWDWYNLGWRGRQLEKGIASGCASIGAKPEGWSTCIGSAVSATPRFVMTVMSSITSPNTRHLADNLGRGLVFMVGKRCYEFTHEMSESENGSVLTFNFAHRSVSSGFRPSPMECS